MADVPSTLIPRDLLQFTLGELAENPIVDRTNLFMRLAAFRPTFEQALRAARIQGLPQTIEIEVEDVAFAMAQLIEEIVPQSTSQSIDSRKVEPNAKPRIAGNPLHSRNWDRNTVYRTVWDKYLECHQSEMTLAGLLWSISFETKDAWRRPGTKLNSSTATQAWNYAYDSWFKTPNQKAAASILWECHWSRSARARFRGIQHPRNYVQSEANRPPKKPRTNQREQLASQSLINIVKSLRTEKFKPGQLGELLRDAGFEDVLFIACEKLSTTKPTQALYCWLYHAVGFRQIEMTKKHDYPQLVRKAMPGFVNASQESVSQQIKRGEEGLMREILTELRNRFTSSGGSIDGLPD